MSQEKNPPRIPDRHDKGDTQLLTREKKKTKKPSLYQVLLLNDDYTPQEFVTWILQKIFFKNLQDATAIMLECHTKGRAVAGTYTHDVARTKVMQVSQLAKKQEYPLECIMQVVEG